jgi:hypothetical protein
MFKKAAPILAVFAFVVAGLGEARAQEAGRRTVCVVSAIGETFTLKKVGIMVFGNEQTELPIDAWGIDDQVVAKINMLLGSHFTVRKIAYPRGAFAALQNTSVFKLFSDGTADFRDIVRKVVARQTCDLDLVVSNTVSPFGSTNQTILGLGMVESGAGEVFLHALTVVTVFDGRTFEILRDERTSIGQNTFLATIKGPHREVPSSAWPTSRDLSENEPLHRATWALVEQSLAMTVPGLFKAD